MSYILDALKKAQAENDPDVRTSLAAEMRDKRRYRNLLMLIGLALLGNGLVLIYIFAPGPWQQSGPAAPSFSQSGSAASSLPERSADTAESSADGQPPANDQAVGNAAALSGTTTPSVSREPVSAQPARRVQAPPPAAPPQPVRATLSTLPPGVRARFPGLAFSTHVYASDPDLRAVVVNGQRLVEGDRLDNLRLAEITETGVVFSFENYLVSVPVLEDWE